MARDSLIDKDLIAFDGTLFQVLDLPSKHVAGALQVDHEHSKKRAAMRTIQCAYLPCFMCKYVGGRWWIGNLYRHRSRNLDRWRWGF